MKFINIIEDYNEIEGRVDVSKKEGQHEFVGTIIEPFSIFMSRKKFCS